MKNNKGYMLVEIIIASVITMTIAYLLLDLTYSFKTNNDDTFYETIFLTEKTLMTKEVMNDINNNNVRGVDFSCNNTTDVCFEITFQNGENSIIKRLTINNNIYEYGTYKNNAYDSSDYYKKTINNKLNISRPNIVNHCYEETGDIVNGILTCKEESSDTYALNGMLEITLPLSSNYLKEDLGVKISIPYSTIEVENYPVGTSTMFDYSGDYRVWTAPKTGTYKIELWGGQGGTKITSYPGGLGGYTSGKIILEEGTKLYIYVGGQGGTTANVINFNNGTGNCGGWNGGGATDVRLEEGTWNEIKSLRSRIMVAGGGGTRNGGIAGAGGGISGISGSGTTGGTQTTFGGVQSTSYTVSSFGVANGGCTGGNGYYPGGGATCANGSGGGSSYISGHTGCVAVTSENSTTPKSDCTTGTTNNTCSIHYSNFKFFNTTIIDGTGYKWENIKSVQEKMPNPAGGFYDLGIGHSGDGYARITFINTETTNPTEITYNYGDGSLNTVSRGYEGVLKANGLTPYISTEAYFTGNYASLGKVGTAPEPITPYNWILTAYIEKTGTACFTATNGNKNKALVYSGTNNYSFFQISGEKTVYLAARGGGLTTGVSISGMKLYVNGGYYTLKQCVDNGYIKPLVIFGSQAQSANYTWTFDLASFYNGGATDTKNFPGMHVIFMTNTEYPISGFQLTSTKAFDTTYDGYSVWALDINDLRLTIE